MKVYHQILLIGFFIGLIAGYTWHYQATKNLNFIKDDTQVVMLNDKIPAELIEVNYEKINQKN